MKYNFFIKSLLWLSLYGIFHAFVGYPFVLRMVSIFHRKPIHKDNNHVPPVTLIISAYNEEKVIEKKIRNSLDLDYPESKLEIMVVSDASSDSTDKIVMSYIDQGVKHLRIEGRVGKTSCLNKAIPVSRGEIIVFSDANSLYPRETIRNIVQNFADNAVGCVTGYTRYISDEADTVIGSLGLYSYLEMITKELESTIGSCVGADGAIFAIRKSLYRPLRETDINDLVIPLTIVAQGYRVVIERDAFCFEETAKDPKGEFNRQVRITNRTIRAIFTNAFFFNIRQYGLFAFELFSHKIMKFLVPLFLLTALGSNFLLMKRHSIYKLLMCVQGFLYTVSILNLSKISIPLIKKISFICRTFVVVNLAIIKGWISYFRGENITVWRSTR